MKRNLLQLRSAQYVLHWNHWSITIDVMIIQDTLNKTNALVRSFQFYGEKKYFALFSWLQIFAVHSSHLALEISPDINVDMMEIWWWGGSLLRGNQVGTHLTDMFASFSLILMIWVCRILLNQIRTCFWWIFLAQGTHKTSRIHFGGTSFSHKSLNVPIAFIFLASPAYSTSNWEYTEHFF